MSRFLESKIIQIQLGGCGNRLGCAYWNLVMNEHSISTKNGDYLGKDAGSDLDLAKSIFYEVNTVGLEAIRFRPACICVGTDQSDNVTEALADYDIDCVSRDQIVQLSGNNGDCSDVDVNPSQIVDAIRLDIERADHVGGFELLHSVTGKFTTNCTTNLMTSLKDNYPKKLMVNGCVFPSSSRPSRGLKKIGSLSLLKSLIEHSDGCFLYDNETLENVWTRSLMIDNVDLQDLNQLIAFHLSGISASYRLKGSLNKSLYSLVKNACPIEQMHFFLPSIAPILSQESRLYARGDILELTRNLFDRRNALFCPNSSKRVKYFGMSGVYRGYAASPWDIRREMYNLKERRNLVFSNSNFLYEHAVVSSTNLPCDIPITAAVAWSSSAITSIFKNSESQSEDNNEELIKMQELYEQCEMF
ncbi:hypothetical protein ACOME3_003447 [Neoechinorhynchus agilis]